MFFLFCYCSSISSVLCVMFCVKVCVVYTTLLQLISDFPVFVSLFQCATLNVVWFVDLSNFQ